MSTDPVAERFNRERETDVIEGMARYGWTMMEALAILRVMVPDGGLPFVAEDYGHLARRAAAVGGTIEGWLESFRSAYPDTWDDFVQPALVKVWLTVSQTDLREMGGPPFEEDT